uniref:Uncharacterized protein n=1 Tax=Tanacetum cinerariifolium TaxID=118510 RepID=A0A6L2KZL1_TANCI|nr:hypothetical protein [Tanacetum cinerariifolium]
MLEVREVDTEEEVQVPAPNDVDQENVTLEIADDVAQPTSPLPPSLVIPSSPHHQSPRPPPPQAAEEVQEAVEIITTAKLMTEVVAAAATQVVAVSTPIPSVKPAVVAVSTHISAAKPAAKPKVLKIVVAALAVSTRKRKGVVIRDPEEELHDDTPAETLSVKDKGKCILIKDPKPMKKKDQIEMDAEYARKLQEEEESFKKYIKRYHGYKKKPQSKSKACKNMIAYLKNIKGFKMAFFKGKTYDQIRLIFQARFDANMRFLLKSREEIEKEEDEIIKSINKTPAQKAAKRRRLREQAKEDENLKKQLEVVVDEDDDVFIEATPIGRKVPVVNYEIVMINNKPRYKIIRADDTHQLYTSFLTLLKNFDREDLEDLWKIVKARFSTSKPTNFSDDYLLVTLKTMFEKTDAQDVIWRSQQTEYGQALSNVDAASLRLKLFKDVAAVADANQNRRDLPMNTPLDRVEVLGMIEKRSKSGNNGIVQTEVELVLEQTQQGEEDVVMGEGMVVTSSSLEMLTNSRLRGIMVGLIFLEGLEEKS